MEPQPCRSSCWLSLEGSVESFLSFPILRKITGSRQLGTLLGVNSLSLEANPKSPLKRPVLGAAASRGFFPSLIQDGGFRKLQARRGFCVASFVFSHVPSAG